MAGLGDLAGLLKQAQQMQREVARVQEELKTRVVEGSAGGGAVRVRVNGGLEVVSVHIDRSAVNPAETDLLEDLVLTASRQAIDRARELGKAELGKLTGGLSLPGMF